MVGDYICKLNQLDVCRMEPHLSWSLLCVIWLLSEVKQVTTLCFVIDIPSEYYGRHNKTDMSVKQC